MAIPSFIFGGDTGETPDSIKRKREMAQALMSAQRAPRNVGEGLNALGDGIVSAVLGSRADAGEKAGREGANSAFNSIAGALAGPSAFPSAPGAPSQGASDGLNPVQSAHDMEHERDPSIAGLQIKGGIEATAKALGIDPVDLATAISYETGGTFDPAKAGPTTKWGQHRGLIQFGEPQAKQYGVDWNNPVGSQLGPDGAIAKYLRDTGVKPGMGMLDIYSAINAGGVGRYGASDTAAGGAPGTVADKVNSQMAGHRAKAMAMFGDSGQASAPPAPVQVASLDPSAGVAEAMRPMPEEYAKNGMSQATWERMNAPNGAVPAPSPRQNVVNAVQQATPPQQQAYPQIAQALVGGDKLPVTAGGSGGAIQYGPQGGPSLQMLMETANQPFLNDNQRSIVNALIGQQIKANDPNSQLDMEYKRAQIDALKAKPDQTPESVRALDIRAKQAGLQPGTPEYQQFMISGGSGPQTIINNGGNSNKFVEKSDEAAAKRMDDIVASGQTAPQTMADMQQLIDLGAQIGTGKGAQIMATIGPYAQALGIDIKNMNEMQAYEAITSRLAPQMRAVGSGASSDRDVSMFLQSLPNLRNLQGGNEIIANTMKAVSQNKINAAEIASKAQRGEISWQDADKQIRELPNPYELFKGFQKQTQDSKKTVIDGYTIEEVE